MSERHAHPEVGPDFGSLAPFVDRIWVPSGRYECPVCAFFVIRHDWELEKVRVVKARHGCRSIVLLQRWMCAICGRFELGGPG